MRSSFRQEHKILRSQICGQHRHLPCHEIHVTAMKLATPLTSDTVLYHRTEAHFAKILCDVAHSKILLRATSHKIFAKWASDNEAARRSTCYLRDKTSLTIYPTSENICWRGNNVREPIEREEENLLAEWTHRLFYCLLDKAASRERGHRGKSQAEAGIATRWPSGLFKLSFQTFDCQELYFSRDVWHFMFLEDEETPSNIHFRAFSLSSEMSSNYDTFFNLIHVQEKNTELSCASDTKSQYFVMFSFESYYYRLRSLAAILESSNLSVNIS